MAQIHQLYSAELQEEKRKDYRNVVAAQAGLLLVSLLTDDWLRHEMLGFLLFQLCAIVYLWLLWDLSRNFTFVKAVPRVLGWMAFLVTAISVLFNLVFYQPAWGPSVNGALHGVTILIQCGVMSLGLRDLVRGPRRASDKLWAAAGLYIMLGIIFGEIIHFVHLLQPDTLGPGILPTVRGFHEALYLSFATLTGADIAIDNISHLCRNITVVEALLAQLYMVMLISRLLISDKESESVEALPTGEPAPMAGTPTES